MGPVSPLSSPRLAPSCSHLDYCSGRTHLRNVAFADVSGSVAVEKVKGSPQVPVREVPLLQAGCGRSRAARGDAFMGVGTPAYSNLGLPGAAASGVGGGWEWWWGGGGWGVVRRVAKPRRAGTSCAGSSSPGQGANGWHKARNREPTHLPRTRRTR